MNRIDFKIYIEQLFSKPSFMTVSYLHIRTIFELQLEIENWNSTMDEREWETNNNQNEMWMRFGGVGGGE